MSRKNSPQIIECPSGLPVYFTGPSLELGALPAFFYFALSGNESLELPPFNQPALLLKDSSVRVFSCTIPGHGLGMKNTEAMSQWTQQIEQEIDPITPFLTQCVQNIDFLIAEGVIDPQHLAAGGLSRGAFIATHIAAKHKSIGAVLGYSPLTTLKTIQEFGTLADRPIAQSLELTNAIPGLIGKQLRFYIGNRDVRVGTEECFRFIRHLTEESYLAGIRSPHVELHTFPSIGHKGHGTPAPIFQEGVDWLKNQIKPAIK